MQLYQGAYKARPRKMGNKKIPSNPPLAQKCTLCKDFPYAGNTVNFIRNSYRDCGQIEQRPHEKTYTYDPMTCKHEVVDHRENSRSISRIFSRQWGIFMDEESREFYA